MKTLYISRINSGQPELTELKVRSVLNKHVFFQLQLLFCCILFLFSSTAVMGQNSVVNTNKPSYFPGESVVISGSVWQPNEQIRLVIENVNFPLETDTIFAVADENGVFESSSYTIAPDEDNALYVVSASSDISAASAETSFASALGLSQGHNGGIGEPAIDPVIWVNGNANAQNSHYLEGNSIPYRVILNDVPAGIHVIRLKWDIKHSGKHAIDFITSFKRSIANGGISELVEPTSDIPAGIFDVPNYYPIPTPGDALVVNGKAQPSTAFLGLPAADRQMACFNGQILSIVYLYEGDISMDNSTTEIEITYETFGESEYVMFAWSGHIANRTDWGPGSSAGAINGSPYHTALGNSDLITGAQDRSLKADAVQFFPTCALEGPEDSCPGDTISVTATTNAPSPQFTWSATNGAIIIGSGATVSVVSPASGPYTVSVNIVDFFDNQVISEESNCSIDINILQDPVVAAGADQEQCLGIDGRDFTVSGSVSFGDFEWVVVSGEATIDNPDSLTTDVHLGINSNEVVIRLQAIGSCAEQSDDLTLKVNLEPVVQISSSDDPDCLDGSGSYSVQSGEGLTYQWSISGNAQIQGSSTGASVSILADNLCSTDFSLSVIVTDANGCIGYDTLGFSFSDVLPPVISDDAGADTTIACPGIPEFDPPSATDACDQSPEIHQLDDVVIQGDCDGEYTVTRGWYFSDNCENLSDTVYQMITVIDDTAPIITQDPGDDEVIACPAAPEFDAPEASDECSVATIHQLEDDMVNGDCEGEYVVTRGWYFTDDCGNVSDTVYQSITVVDDTAPIITEAEGNDTIIACPAIPEFSAPSASDECSDVTIHQLDDDIVQGQCAGTYTVTRGWYFTDDCDNASDTVYQVIQVIDNVAPVISEDAGGDTIIACPNIPSFDPPSATDACDAEPQIHQLDDVVENGNCAAEYTITRSWYFTDACGNISDTVSQTIGVEDEVAPIIVSGPGDDATIVCPAEPEFQAPTASDACTNSPTIHQLEDERTEGDCAAEYYLKRSWYFTDECGKISDTVSQTIHVIDNVAPEISEGAGADTTINCPAVPEFDPPSATDACDEAPEIHQLDDVVNDGDCEAEYSITRSWYFTDACGNISDTVSQTINVIDSIAPLLSEPADLEIECNEIPEFTEPSYTDNCSLAEIQASGPDTTYVNGDMVLTMTWIAIDACGNQSESVDQAITVHACPEIFCSLTQGFYGNAKGIACATGERGRPLMIRLLSAPFGSLVIGAPGRSLTINAADVDCLIGDMPAGGPAMPLALGNNSYAFNCVLPAVFTSPNNGRFRNVLLGQVITLGLNLRLDAELGGLQLEGTQMTTYGGQSGADGLCGTEDDIINVDDVRIRMIPASVLTALDAEYAGDRSVANLFLLANRLLGGETISGVSLSQINQAVSAINEGFDGCRFLGGFGSAKSDESNDIIELVTGKELNYKVFPNPFSLSTTIEFVTTESMEVKIDLYSIKGELITTLYDDVAEGDVQNRVILDGSMLQNGMYFCRIYTKNEVYETRIILNK